MKQEPASYEHGTFSWVELSTADAPAAKRFYGALFDWTFLDVPAGPDLVYTMCKLNGRDAAALYQLAPDAAAPRGSHWTSYVTVDDVDVRSTRAIENGGQLIKPPFDVLDVGRMSLVRDPTGAECAFWQAKKHAGADVKDEPGAFTYNELWTNDPERARAFYERTLDWQSELRDMGVMGTYTLFKSPAAGASRNAGGMMRSPAGSPAQWLVYFSVASCDSSSDRARAVGGKVVVPPTDIPNIGRFSVLHDPQGATFALFQMGH